MGVGVRVGVVWGMGNMFQELSIVKCALRYCTILRIIKKIRGEGNI